MRRHGCAKTRNRSRGVIRRHLKFMGVQNTTLACCSLAAERFWAYCDFRVGHVRRSARELDLHLGEYIHHFFFTLTALSNGCDILAAVRRCLLSRRDSTYLAKASLRNWSRTQHVRRAVPLSLKVVLGWHVVGALYVGFVCLLRTGEILTLKADPLYWPCLPPKVPNSRTWVSQLLCLTPQQGRCSLSSVWAARLKTRCFGFPLKEWHPVSLQQQLLLVTGLQTCFLIHFGEAGLLSISLGVRP